TPLLRRRTLVLGVRRPRGGTLFPYTTLFRSRARPTRRGWSRSRRTPGGSWTRAAHRPPSWTRSWRACPRSCGWPTRCTAGDAPRSEEHTSELQSRENLVCRLLLEKKKKTGEV